MASAPDILVTAHDSPHLLLVVEAKLATMDLAEFEAPLKRYMVQMGAPVGLLVTPTEIAIYRNRYIATSEISIERVGHLQAPESFPFLSRFRRLASEERIGPRVSHETSDFEEHIQSWLERSSESGTFEGLPPQLQDAFSDYILPALQEGIIRAAHPREYFA